MPRLSRAARAQNAEVNVVMLQRKVPNAKQSILHRYLWVEFTAAVDLVVVEQIVNASAV